MQKHKLASISLTVQNRGILSKFSTPRVSRVYWQLFTKITFPVFGILPLKNVTFLKFHPPSSILSEIENVDYLKKPLETE